jgi:hypothetical protein
VVEQRPWLGGLAGARRERMRAGSWMAAAWPGRVRCSGKPGRNDVVAVREDEGDGKGPARRRDGWGCLRPSTVGSSMADSITPAARGRTGKGGSAHRSGLQARVTVRWRVDAGESRPCRTHGNGRVDVRAQARWRGSDEDGGRSTPGGGLPRAGGFLSSSAPGGSSPSSSSPPFLP